MRMKFFIYGFLLFLIVAAVYYYFKLGFLLLIAIPILLVVGIFNTIQKKHAILRNFPVLGYFSCRAIPHDLPESRYFLRE